MPKPLARVARIVRAGFTVVELLAVIALVGILSGVALVKYNNVQDRAYEAAMKNDLNNYANIQEVTASTTGGYASSPDSLAGFRYSPGVSTATALGGGSMWWLAVKHDNTDNRCIWGRSSDNTIKMPYMVCSDKNLPPVASMTIVPKPVRLTASVTASGANSFDPDGVVSGYSWDFGDSYTATGLTATHTYATRGWHKVDLTTTDALGATGVTTDSVLVDGPPVAHFTVSPATGALVAGRVAWFNGTSSSDEEGPIAAYSWDFGALGTANTATVSVLYPTDGTFSPALTVTDAIGNTASTTQNYTVIPNQAPAASFTVSDTHPGIGASVSFDASASSDPDGTVSAYSWDMGDATTATGKTIAHTYSTSGSYTIVLTVADDLGATATASRSVVVNTAPAAAFSVTDSLATNADIGIVNTSADPDAGQTLTYAWDMGDGATLTTQSPSHSYASPGNYTVTLKVTDPYGLSNQVSHSVTALNQPPNAPTLSCTPTNLPTGSPATCTATGATDPDGGTVSYVWSATSKTSSTGGSAVYSTNAPGSVSVSVTATDGQGGTSTAGTTSVTFANRPPTATFSVDATSKNTSSNFIFTASASDPDGGVIGYSWDFGDSGSSNISAPTHAYSTPGTYSVALTVTDGQGGTYTTPAQTMTAVNRPPSTPGIVCTPASTPSGSSVTCTASGSADPDGGSVVYQWSATGLTSPATGSSATYTRATPGSVSVTATAADGQGGTSPASTAVSLTFTNRPPTATFSVDATTKSTGSAFAFTANASDPDGGVVSYSWNFGDTGASTLAAPTHPYVTPGTYLVALTVTDGQGGTYTTPAQTLTATNRPPSTPAVSCTPTSTPTGSSATCTTSGSTDPDGGTVAYNWSAAGRTGAATGSSTTYSQNTPGALSVTTTATDGQGGTSPMSAAASVTFTNRPPSGGTMSCSPTSAPTGSNISCTTSGWSDPDGGNITSDIDFNDGSYNYISSGSGAGGSYTRVLTSAAPGTYYVMQYAKDDQGSGWVSTGGFVPITFTNRPPAGGTMSCTPTSAPTGSNITCTTSGWVDPDGGNITSDIDFFNGSYTWLSGTGGPGSSYSRTVSGSTPGTYYVLQYAHDDQGSGWVSAGGYMALTFTNRLPSAPAITASSYSVPTGTPVTFTGAASTDPDGSVVKHVWYLLDPGSPASPVVSSAYSAAGACCGYATYDVAGNGTSITAQWNRPGTYQVGSGAIDNNGGASWSLTGGSIQNWVVVQVTDRPPTATETCTASINMGSSFYCSMSASDPDGGNMTYYWDVWDTSWNYYTSSSWSGSSAFTFTPSVPGGYYIVGRLQDDQGSGTITPAYGAYYAYGSTSASFNVSNTHPAVNETVGYYAGTSAYVSAYSWDYGVYGATGSGQNSYYNYPVSGNFTTSLTVYGMNGYVSNSSTSQVIYVYNPVVAPNATFYGPSSVGYCDFFNGFYPAYVSTSTGTGPLTYSWTMSSSQGTWSSTGSSWTVSNAYGLNGSINGVSAATLTVSLTVSGPGGNATTQQITTVTGRGGKKCVAPT